MSKYNNGTVVAIDKIPKEEKLMAIKEFSEGSFTLEQCLLALNELGIATRSCCKGQHISVANDFRTNTKFLDICFNSFIAFESNQDWKGYLSKELINDPDVIICDDSIEYYGYNCEGFFLRFYKDLLTGKKNNYDLLANKASEPTQKMLIQSYVYALHKIGFNKDQIMELGDLFATGKTVEEAKRYRQRTQELIREVLGNEEYEKIEHSKQF